MAMINMPIITDIVNAITIMVMVTIKNTMATKSATIGIDTMEINTMEIDIIETETTETVIMVIENRTIVNATITMVTEGTINYV